MLRIFLVFFLVLNASQLVAQPETLNWYRAFSGSIGKTMITLHLHKVEHEYYGYYYYDRVQQPINITGHDTTAGSGKIYLMAYLPGNRDMSEIFMLAWNGKVLVGDWQKDEKTKAIPVRLEEKTQLLPDFEMVYTSGIVKLRPSLAASPAASYLAVSVWPSGTTTSSAFIKRIINEDFGAKDNQEYLAKILMANRKMLFKEYLEENQGLADSIFTGYPSAYTLAEERKLLVTYHSSKILTLASHAYAYTGGAHGNYGTRFITIDLEANKKLSLGHVLTSSGIGPLKTELEKQFRQQAGLKENEPLTEAGLFENKIEPNDNFYLTGKGIGFSYMPYEIGPYVLGEINVFIPIGQLLNYLQPSARKLFTR